MVHLTYQVLIRPVDSGQVDLVRSEGTTTSCERSDQNFLSRVHQVRFYQPKNFGYKVGVRRLVHRRLVIPDRVENTVLVLTAVGTLFVADIVLVHSSVVLRGLENMNLDS